MVAQKTKRLTEWTATALHVSRTDGVLVCSLADAAENPKRWIILQRQLKADPQDIQQGMDAVHVATDQHEHGEYCPGTAAKLEKTTLVVKIKSREIKSPLTIALSFKKPQLEKLRRALISLLKPR